MPQNLKLTIEMDDELRDVVELLIEQLAVLSDEVVRLREALPPRPIVASRNWWATPSEKVVVSRDW